MLWLLRIRIHLILFNVSINSTSEEVLWRLAVYERVHASYLFPLIPLPKKCCDFGIDPNLVSNVVSINSTSEEVLWPYNAADQGVTSDVSINSTSEEVLWHLWWWIGWYLSTWFPLIPLPKKCCDFPGFLSDVASMEFPLIPLPKKCCDPGWGAMVANDWSFH